MCLELVGLVRSAEINQAPSSEDLTSSTRSPSHRFRFAGSLVGSAHTTALPLRDVPPILLILTEFQYFHPNSFQTAKQFALAYKVDDLSNRLKLSYLKKIEIDAEFSLAALKSS